MHQVTRPAPEVAPRCPHPTPRSSPTVATPPSAPGRRSAAGKEQSRRNALKHGLAADVVVPEEQAGEVALRVALLQESLAPDDDGFALILAERAGYLSMRLKRCYVHEEAMIARRVRDAGADYDDERCTAAEHVLSYIANEPPTGSRQLRSTPEGVDILIGWLRGDPGRGRLAVGGVPLLQVRRGDRPPVAGADLVAGPRADRPDHQGGPEQAPAGGGRRHPRGGTRRLGAAGDRPRGRRRVGAAPRPPRHARPRPVRRQPRRGGPARHPDGRQGDGAGAEVRERRGAGLRPDAQAARRVPPRATPVAGRGADRGPRRHRPRLAAEARERRDAAPTRSWRPRAGAGLGSFVPATDCAIGPIDAANFTIGKATATPFVTSKPPRYTP